MKMTKTGKKALALSLAALLVLSLVPLNTIGAEKSAEGDYTYVVKNGEAKITKVNKSISGEQTIPETLGGYPVTKIVAFAFSGCTALTGITIPEGVTKIAAGTFSFCTGLKNATVPNTVTAIDYNAFRQCSELKNIVIPDSVTHIGEGAFSLCTALTEITVPDSVININSGAFYGCSALSNIDLSNGVKNMGDYVFQNCSSLTGINIPNSLLTIGARVFWHCPALNTIEVAEDNPSFTSEGGVLFNKDKTQLIQYPAGKAGENYNIPEGVTDIFECAFHNCATLTNITVPESVTSVGDGAFAGTGVYNSFLSSPDNVLYMGNCLIRAKNTVNGEYEVTDGTKTVADMAFCECSNLTKITFPTSVTHIGNKSFYKCGSLSSIDFGSGVKNIGNYAFYECSALTNVTLPGSAENIGDAPFNYCNALTSIEVADENPYFTSENEVLFNSDKTRLIQYPIGKTDEDYEIPNGVKSIGDGAFENCTFIKNITFHGGITTIGNCAFMNCNLLKDISLPESLTNIGEKSFYYSGYYKNEENWENGVLYIGKCLIKANQTVNGNYNVKSETKTIAAGAFGERDTLESITIPDSVTNIGSGAFKNCCFLEEVYYLASKAQWDEINISDINNEYLLNATVYFPQEIEGAEYIYTVDEQGNATITAAANFTGTEITIPQSIDGYPVTKIGEGAFSGCSSLTDITIPAGVTDIGGQAFSGCTALETIIIPGSVTNIGENAFGTCTSLTDVYYDGDETDWDKIDGNGELAGEIIRYSATYSQAKLPEITSKTAKYKNNVTVKLTATGIPESGFLVVDGMKIAPDANGNAVFETQFQAKETKTFRAKIVNRNEEERVGEKEYKVNVDTGFFAKLVAFFTEFLFNGFKWKSVTVEF